MRARAAVAAVVALALHLSVARAAVISAYWRVSWAFVAPDGVEKAVAVVNGVSPGPVLEGRVGDRVRVVVENALHEEGTSVHWHGVRQRASPWSDGVPGVSQCAVEPGARFVYEFELEAPGTLWWHSHSAFQRGSLHGAIVVHGDEGPALEVDGGDVVLVLNDWYHESDAELLAGLDKRLPDPFRWVGPPQSLLINGRGAFDCANTSRKCDANHPDAGPFVMRVEPGRRYRLRIVGAASQSFLNFAIHNHLMEVVEVETQLLQPFHTDSLDVASGKSCSVILTAYTEKELREKFPDSNGNFWMQVNVRHRHKGPRGLAVLRYSFAEDELPREPVPDTWPGRNDVDWSLNHARRFKAFKPVAIPEPDRRWVFLGEQIRLENGALAWAINKMAHQHATTPIMQTIILGLDAEKAKWRLNPALEPPRNRSAATRALASENAARRQTTVVKVKKNEVIEIVFQSAHGINTNSETHPWHLHLTNFWVMGYGNENTTWTQADVASYDNSTAVHRNTVSQFPRSWTAIRFRADNAGAATLHCHALAHMHMGMGMVLHIGEAQDLPRPPRHTHFCGAAREFGGNGEEYFRTHRAPPDPLDGIKWIAAWRRRTLF